MGGSAVCRVPPWYWGGFGGGVMLGADLPPPPPFVPPPILQGGGWRFPRYNCSVAAPPPGWALLHPGRLTHRAEVLHPTRGAHYALVTLLDP